jgi:hypothetical protein
MSQYIAGVLPAPSHLTSFAQLESFGNLIPVDRPVDLATVSSLFLFHPFQLEACPSCWPDCWPVCCTRMLEARQTKHWAPGDPAARCISAGREVNAFDASDACQFTVFQALGCSLQRVSEQLPASRRNKHLPGCLAALLGRAMQGVEPRVLRPRCGHLVEPTVASQQSNEV